MKKVASRVEARSFAVAPARLRPLRGTSARHSWSPLRFERRMVVGDGFEPSKAKPADLQSAFNLMDIDL